MPEDISILVTRYKADYYMALQQTKKPEDMNVFYTFMFDQYRKHLEAEIAAYNQAMSRKAGPKKGKGSGYSLFF
jgi:hypothetical protein